MPRFLFVSTDTLGDLILREPLFRLARRHGTEIALIVRDSFMEAAQMVAPNARLIPISINPYAAGDVLEAEAGRVSLLAREWNPDEVICLLKTTNRFDVALFSRLDGVIRRRFAVVPAERLTCLRAIIEPHKPAPPEAELMVSVHEDESESVAYAELARALGWTFNAGDMEPRLDGSLFDADSCALSRPRVIEGDYVVSSPIGIGNLSIKSWPTDTLCKTVEHLREHHGLKCLFVGVPDEEAELNALAAKCGASVWIGGAGRLGELCRLIYGARAYVGADKGPMHLAAAMNRPVFGLFGGGAGNRFFPRARRSVVVTQRLACFNCGWNCLLPQPHCITDIPWERIREGVDRLLESTEPGRWVFDGGPIRPGSFVLAERLGEKLVESESDRTARLLAMQSLEKLLTVSETDRAARLEVIHSLENRLKESEADRAARLEVIHSLENRLKESEADRTARFEVMHSLENRLKESEADRAARLEVIHAQEGLLRERENLLAEQEKQLREWENMSVFRFAKKCLRWR